MMRQRWVSTVCRLRFSDIHHGHVGLMLAGRLHRLDARAGFGDHVEFGVALQNVPESLAHQSVIVGQKNANRHYAVTSLVSGGAASTAALSSGIRSAILVPWYLPCYTRVAFAIGRDRLCVAITLAVLAVLVYSLTTPYGGG